MKESLAFSCASYPANNILEHHSNTQDIRGYIRFAQHPWGGQSVIAKEWLEFKKEVPKEPFSKVLKTISGW